MKTKTESKIRVPFFRHDLGKQELDAVAKVLEGPILTTGETVAQFESRFADYLNKKYVLGVTSCTGALHMSLTALGIGPGDEVITTPMTFIATATAILESGAMPVFVDIEEDTGNLDVNKVEAAITKKTKAILPVHLYGLMSDMRTLGEIADRHGLFLIEDCAHSLEGKRDGIRAGELGDTACYSFYATKSITCGEGGAVVTDGEEMFERLKLLRLHGMTKTGDDRHREGYRHWDVTLMGWKYNMDNIQAALLLPQLDRIEQNLAKRQKLAKLYEQRLAGINELRLQATRPNVVHAHHMFPIWVNADHRDWVIERLRDEGIETTVNFRAVHLLSYFAKTFGYSRSDFPNAEKLGGGTISLPFYPNMPEEYVDMVANCLIRILKEI